MRANLPRAVSTPSDDWGERTERKTGSEQDDRERQNADQTIDVTISVDIEAMWRGSGPNVIEHFQGRELPN